MDQNEEYNAQQNPQQYPPQYSPPQQQQYPPQDQNQYGGQQYPPQDQNQYGGQQYPPQDQYQYGSQQYPPQSQYQYGPQQYPPQYQQQTSSQGRGLSVASLVLGIISLFIPYGGIVMAIAGLILGVMGKKKCIEFNEPTGMATAGIVLSVIALAFSVILIIICTSCLGAAACASGL